MRSENIAGAGASPTPRSASKYCAFLEKERGFGRGKKPLFTWKRSFFPLPKDFLLSFFSKEEEFEGADDGEGHDDVVEEFLGHFFKEEDADGGADDDNGEHEEVEFDGLDGDASFNGEDGDFDPVDDEEEP